MERELTSDVDDLAFLREMLQRLQKGRCGDPTQLEMVEKMISDWIEEKEEQKTVDV